MGCGSSKSSHKKSRANSKMILNEKKDNDNVEKTITNKNNNNEDQVKARDSKASKNKNKIKKEKEISKNKIIEVKKAKMSPRRLHTPRDLESSVRYGTPVKKSSNKKNNNSYYVDNNIDAQGNADHMESGQDENEFPPPGF